MTTAVKVSRLAIQRSNTAPIWLRVLNWIADRDANYRASQKLQSMPDERLEDMGIAREEIKKAFQS